MGGHLVTTALVADGQMPALAGAAEAQEPRLFENRVPRATVKAFFRASRSSGRGGGGGGVFCALCRFMQADSRST